MEAIVCTVHNRIYLEYEDEWSPLYDSSQFHRYVKGFTLIEGHCPTCEIDAQSSFDEIFEEFYPCIATIVTRESLATSRHQPMVLSTNPVQDYSADRKSNLAIETRKSVL